MMNISPINYKQSNLIPGPFIISQGSSGDGMSNTIDTLPILPQYDDEHDKLPSYASDYERRRTIEKRRGIEKYDEESACGNFQHVDSQEYQEYIKNRYGDGESLQTLHEYEQSHVNDLMHDVSLSQSSAEIIPKSPVNNRNNKAVYRPRSNSDTEGGLHSPIGHHSLTSPPIMQCAGGVQSLMSSPTLQCDKEKDNDIPAKHLGGTDKLIDSDNCNSDMICEDISYINKNRTRTKLLSYKEQQSTNQWMKECNEHEVTQYNENIDNIKMLIRRRLTFAATVTTASTATEGMRRGDNTHTADNGILNRSRQEDEAQGWCGSIQTIQTSSPVGTSASASNSESSSIPSQPKAKDPKDTLNEEQEDEEVVGKVVEEDPLQSIELANKHRSWYQRNGRLVIFKSLPYLSAQGKIITKPITSSLVDRLPRSIEEAETGEEVITLSPGCEVYAESVYIIDSKTLLHQIYPPSALSCKETEEDTNPSTDTLQLTMLKISKPLTGYILSSIHSYPLILPGSTSSYINTNTWLWRVTCQPDGAYIREGLELNSKHTGTLPYGTICKVKGKLVNDMGLNRLEIGAWLSKNDLDGSDDEKKPSSSTSFTDAMSYYFGYVSEFLNPLSGQRGNVIEPIPFPTPALYKVISTKGCVIRRGVELSTSQIGLAPKGTILSIVGRSYSDSPKDNCIERLKLAGGGGWISVKLNRDPPDDETLVEMIGPDESFDCDNPARYHFDQTRKVTEELNSSSSVTDIRMGGSSGSNASARRTYSRRRSTYTDISEIADDENDDEQQPLPDTSFSNTINDLGVPTLFRSGVVGVGRTTTNSMDAIRESSSDNHHARNDHPNRCLICLCDERTATIVHGETGHIAACLTCARILKARGDGCPVCRLPVDLVIQHFWA